MPRKLPNRNGDDISVRFNDGWLEILTIENRAAPGYYRKPEFGIVHRLPFQRRTIGVNRYYSAKQNQIEIDMVVRVPEPRGAEITNKNAVRIGDRVFRIDFVQQIEDTFPRCLDLTLIKYEQRGEGHEVV